MKNKPKKGPKILVLDIETSPLISYTWGIWEQNISLNQIKQDWAVIAWSAKWLGDPASKIFYKDQRGAKNIMDDKKILQELWNLIDQADILLTQNGISFDIKKLNARFIMNGMKPPSSYKHIDTKRIASKKFGFTSNKLEYMTEKLCKKYKKSKHKSFPGFELWNECLKGNLKAWKEMEHYNKYDILSLEELYYKLQPWDSSINFNSYSDELTNRCACGSVNFRKNGFKYTSVGKYQRYVCLDCGSEAKDRVNLLSKDKKASLKV